MIFGQSALDQAFTVLPSSQPLSSPPAAASIETKSGQDLHVHTAESADGSTTHTTNDLEDTWKAEYEAQVQSWRAQSAEAREKAEKERLRWESVRAIEKEEATKRKVAGIADEPPKSSNITSADTTSSNTVSSETDSGLVSFLRCQVKICHIYITTLNFLQITASSTQVGPVVESSLSRQDTATEKWEDVPSVTSSFPSMSFPEHGVHTPPHDRRVAPQPAPVSLTSAIFDASLSRRTRLTAFFSSLAVNLLLPFVNGVMLGFGEIFAKNVLMDWLGWHLKPGSVATTVGIRGSSREQRQTFSR